MRRSFLGEYFPVGVEVGRFQGLPGHGPVIRMRIIIVAGGKCCQHLRLIVAERPVKADAQGRLASVGQLPLGQVEEDSLRDPQDFGGGHLFAPERRPEFRFFPVGTARAPDAAGGHDLDDPILLGQLVNAPAEIPLEVARMRRDGHDRLVGEPCKLQLYRASNQEPVRLSGSALHFLLRIWKSGCRANSKRP